MTLHPQSQAYLEQIAAKRGPGWDEIPVEEGRRLFNSLDMVFGQGPELYAVEDHILDSQIPIRIYRPSEQSTAQPMIVYFHGGGWVVGNIQTHDAVCRRLAKESGFIVLSVEYRLAPDHKYPAAFEDAYMATKYVSEHARELGGDPHGLMVAGDSAGGNLAAAVALKARDEGGPKITRQILIYPVIEPDFTTASYTAFAEYHGLTKASMEWFWEQYLADGDANRRYACLANVDVQDLPPAIILTAEYDVLRDEGENFARRLQGAGVAVILRRYAGMLHGFVHFAGVFDDSLTAIRDIAKLIADETTSDR